MRKDLTEKQFRKIMETKVRIPDGFTAKFTKGSCWDNSPFWDFTLVSPDVEIRFDSYGGGHTRYLANGNWYGRDRTGVSDSFYWRDFDGKIKPDLNALVAEEFGQIAKSREYLKTAISVPGLPFTVSPERLPTLKADIRKRGHISFMPSGFGTGYNVTTKPTRRLQYGERRAPKELEAFFGHTPLFISTFDAD